MLGTNYSLTKNNPKESLEEFFIELCKGARYARCQLEIGAEGTPHIQACVGYSQNTRLKAM